MRDGQTLKELHELLEKTSRTFALSIPRLPDPTRAEVTVAYLLFRIADTFEDATASPPAVRVRALEELAGLLDRRGASGEEAMTRRWLTEIRVDHEGYRELVRRTSFLLDAFHALGPGAVDAIRRHVIRTAEGMAGYVSRTKGGELRLADVEELRDYCYVVAGIVGEMLTELFLLGRPRLKGAEAYLHDRARDFGEGLQLVNILKDSRHDAAEHRRFLPEGPPRSAIFDLARRDLVRASEYVLALQEHGAESGIVSFCALPVRLAWATLDRVELSGPGSKIPRTTVWREVRSLEKAVAAGRPAIVPPRSPSSAG